MLNSLENLCRIGTAIWFGAQYSQGLKVVCLVFKKVASTNISGTTNKDEKGDKTECRGSRAE